MTQATTTIRDLAIPFGATPCEPGLYRFPSGRIWRLAYPRYADGCCWATWEPA